MTVLPRFQKTKEMPGAPQPGYGDECLRLVDELTSGGESFPMNVLFEPLEEKGYSEPINTNPR